MKKITLLLLLLAGCCSTDLPKYHFPEVSKEDLKSHAVKVEEHYWANAQYDGIIWQPSRSIPGGSYDRYGKGGDSCLFTGEALATFSYKYGVEQDISCLKQIEACVRGLYILTHCTGTPGVIARCAFPKDKPEKWNYPKSWSGRLNSGFVGNGPDNIEDPFNPGTTFPAMTYYTRTTKDQLTGLLFGLGVAWDVLDQKTWNVTSLEKIQQHKELAGKIKLVIARIAEDVFEHIRKYKYRIKDQKGENGTNADKVDNRMLAQLLAVYAKTSKLTTTEDKQLRIQEKYEEQLNRCYSFPGTLDGIVYRFNNHLQYFAWNLRFLRSMTIWSLDRREETQELVADYVDSWLWPHVSTHYNSHFAFIRNAMHTANLEGLEEGIEALKSLSIKPLEEIQSPALGAPKPSFFEVLFGCDGKYVLPPHLRKPTNYSTWQKEPWGTGSLIKDAPVTDSTGIDYLLAYWMGRYYLLLD